MGGGNNQAGCRSQPKGALVEARVNTSLRAAVSCRPRQPTKGNGEAPHRTVLQLFMDNCQRQEFGNPGLGARRCRRMSLRNHRRFLEAVGVGANATPDLIIPFLIAQHASS